MKTIRQLRLVLTVVLVVLCSTIATPEASARKPTSTSRTTYELVPPTTEPPEPDVYGRYTVTVTMSQIVEVPGSESSVDVTCKELTPDKEYFVMAFVLWSEPSDDGWGSWGSYWLNIACTADSKGRLECQFSVGVLGHTREHRVGNVHLEAVDANGNLVVVLETAP